MSYLITVKVESDDAAKEFIRAAHEYQYVSYSAGWHPLINIPSKVVAWSEREEEDA